MDDATRQAARELVRSLQEALSVIQEQGKRAEAARQETEASREFFTRFLEGCRRGAGPAGAAEQREKWLAHVRQKAAPKDIQEDLRESGRLSTRWATAFCDAHDALMRLYADPESRDAVQQIAGIIRAIRLLQVERLEQELPPGLAQPPSGSEGAGEDSWPRGFLSEAAGAEQGWRGERLVRWFEVMDEWHEQLQDGLREKIDLTRWYLEDALSRARALAG